MNEDVAYARNTESGCNSDLACSGTFYVTRLSILLLSPNPEAQISNVKQYAIEHSDKLIRQDPN